MLEADPAAFAEAVERIDDHLRDEIDRLETSRKQVAQLAAGDSLALPPEVVAYLDRLREIGASERMVEGERDGWILIAARWPDQRPRVDAREARAARGPAARPALPAAVGALRQRRGRRPAPGGGRRHHGRAWPSRPTPPASSTSARRRSDDLPFDLLDALADESDPRVERLRELMRERGWAGWTRWERLPE